MVRRERNNYSLNVTCPSQTPLLHAAASPCGLLASPTWLTCYSAKHNFPLSFFVLHLLWDAGQSLGVLSGSLWLSPPFSEACPHTSFHRIAPIHPCYGTSLLFWTLTQKVQLPPFLLSISLLPVAAKIFSEAVPLSFSQTLIKCPRAFISKFFL